MQSKQKRTNTIEAITFVPLFMAGLTGLEPATFHVTGGRSNQLNYNPLIYGSPGRTRTYDLTINSRALYRLSYRGKNLLALA